MEPSYTRSARAYDKRSVIKIDVRLIVAAVRRGDPPPFHEIHRFPLPFHGVPPWNFDRGGVTMQTFGNKNAAWKGKLSPYFEGKL